jgi:YD repeat-containing protein
MIEDISTSAEINTYYTYFDNGNKMSEIDPDGHETEWTYDPVFHAYPSTVTYPVVGPENPYRLSESYTYEWNWSEGGQRGLLKLTTTDVNQNDTISYYDTFNA